MLSMYITACDTYVCIHVLYMICTSLTICMEAPVSTYVQIYIYIYIYIYVYTYIYYVYVMCTYITVYITYAITLYNNV